ncbi:aminopeptidase N [Psychromarinibacter halotolerans]|uniref:Aminopeptidase N n=1 Tax=Psychromarinibacter halotolerans TaxID=1775175 RepID=A0ABV7GV98_9RHOB|nr:aminopeptidase N [Psychromarinibacter halotolerans]MDF0594509.1 aminopeptidase N [Psychromarinibacter halotolerans]
MKDATPQAVYLSDYTPPAYLVDKVSLVFRLDPAATRVLSRIEFRPNPDAAPGQPLVLDGEKLKLIGAAVAGEAVKDGDHTQTDTGLTIPASRLPAEPFVFEAEVEIDPSANTALEGLYMSNGMYCTQCEAEGFRRITYYPDRPDVMAPFHVRIESDEKVLLSNGNPGASGDGFAEWTDPWPKPAYLFALVAGDLVAAKDSFTTRSGTPVELGIWVRPGDEGKCDYALDALKRSMKWDEDVYGREYDLDVFNIVAVDDFNMGAMENKGLNVFNSKYVLASPSTATDMDYENIEGIIAHEYFHNWTGNRITCRDWFQLCLKEGLTVFRDQQFSGDMRSKPVKRIQDVLQLRARQFREDNGPLAHPVRPSSYIEINNFYTATVYEKGAEVIGMLKRLVGDDGYAKALDLYFDRHDGDAATIEDWLAVFQDATGRDLSQFGRWYTQAGTPRVTVTDDFKDGTYTLHLKQETPATPGQPDKQPQVIPVAVGLLNPNGDEVQPTTVLELTEEQQSFTFDGLSAKPVPSILRGFSAPVILDRKTTTEERAFLLAHDTDPFNKWEAGRALAKDVLARMVTDRAAPGPAYLDALERVARDETLDPAFRALALRLPSEDDMAQTLFDAGVTPDPLAIHDAREKLMLALAEHLSSVLPGLYEDMSIPGPYSPDSKAAGCRALRQTALAMMARLDDGKTAAKQFRDADNMTEQLGALGVLLSVGHGQEELGTFYRQWQLDRLVIDKWFALQSSLAAPGKAADTTLALTRHPDFDWKNPNRFRSVIGGLATNAAGFHDPSGASYELVADWLIRLDPMNPQTTARMTTMFETWNRYDADRQALMRGALQRIAATRGLSRDTTEMVGRILGSA